MSVRTKRLLRNLASGVAVAYVIYLVLGNALLGTSYGYELANRKPEKFVASWSSAWTLYPGHVSARDVRLAGHTRRTVWSLQASSVRGRIALLPLFARQMHVPAVVATGVSGGATRIDVERAPPPPRPGGWTMRFGRIVAENTRYAYFNEFVLQGNGHAEAAFVKTLRGGPMEVLPSRAHFEHDVAFRDGARLAWDARIDMTLSIVRHRREEAPGIRKLTMADIGLEIDAATAGLLLERHDQNRPALTLADGPGRLNGKLAWHRGSLVPGGHLSLAFPARSALDGLSESADATLALRVSDTGIHIAGGVEPVGAGALRASADIEVAGTTLPVQELGNVVKRTSGHFLAKWHFDSLAWVSALLPGPNIVSFDGAGTVLADLRIHEGNLDAGSVLEIPQVAATAAALGNRFDGHAHAKITFEAARPGELRPRLVAEMEGFRISPADSPDEPYVHGRGLHIDAIASGDRATLDDRVRARLRFEDAEVPDLRAYNRYLPNSNLRFLGGVGRVSGDLHFDREGNVGHGTFMVDGRGVRMAMADLALQGDLAVDTRLRRADLKSHQFDADGSQVSLTGVRLTRGDEELGSEWWGHFALNRARLGWDKPATVDGKIQAQLKDASVLLALYAQRKHLPDWVGKVIDAGEVQAEGRIRVHQGTLLLDPLDASNDRFDLMARLRLHEKQVAGDLYARWGALSMGVQLEDGKRQVHLVGARNWYDGRPGLAER